MTQSTVPPPVLEGLGEARIRQLIAEASDPEAIALLIGKKEARSAFSELLVLREIIRDVISASSGSFSNDEAKRALTAIHRRALSPAPHPVDEAV